MAAQRARRALNKALSEVEVRDDDDLEGSSSRSHTAASSSSSSSSAPAAAAAAAAALDVVRRARAMVMEDLEGDASALDEGATSLLACLDELSGLEMKALALSRGLNSLDVLNRPEYAFSAEEHKRLEALAAAQRNHKTVFKDIKHFLLLEMRVKKAKEKMRKMIDIEDEDTALHLNEATAGGQAGDHSLIRADSDAMKEVQRKHTLLNAYRYLMTAPVSPLRFDPFVPFPFCTC